MDSLTTQRAFVIFRVISWIVWSRLPKGTIHEITRNLTKNVIVDRLLLGHQILTAIIHIELALSLQPSWAQVNRRPFYQPAGRRACKLEWPPLPRQVHRKSY